MENVTRVDGVFMRPRRICRRGLASMAPTRCHMASSRDRAAATQVNALKKVPWRFLIIDEAQISVLYLAVPSCGGAFTSSS